MSKERCKLRDHSPNIMYDGPARITHTKKHTTTRVILGDRGRFLFSNKKTDTTLALQNLDERRDDLDVMNKNSYCWCKKPAPPGMYKAVKTLG